MTTEERKPKNNPKCSRCRRVGITGRCPHEDPKVVPRGFRDTEGEKAAMRDEIRRGC